MIHPIKNEDHVDTGRRWTLVWYLYILPRKEDSLGYLPFRNGVGRFLPRIHISLKIDDRPATSLFVTKKTDAHKSLHYSSYKMEQDIHT